MICYSVDNHISELGLLQLCVLLEEGYCSHLVEIDLDSICDSYSLCIDNGLDETSLGYRTIHKLLDNNMHSQKNFYETKRVTTYSLSNQHLSINSKVILQMFTKLTAKWNQLSRQMKFM